jgi:hypothetical protein
MRAGVAQAALVFPLLFSLHVKDVPAKSHHVELVLYADDTAIIVTYCKPKLLISYLESYFNDLEWLLRKLSIALNFSKSTAMLFLKIGRRIPKPRLVQLFSKPINWADTARYLGATLNKRLTWSLHIDHVKKNMIQGLGVFGPFLSMRSGPSVRNGVLLYKQLMRQMMNHAYPI